MNLVDLDFLGKLGRQALCDPCAMIEDPRVAGGRIRCPKCRGLSSAG
jgi:hypothetical protein